MDLKSRIFSVAKKEGGALFVAPGNEGLESKFEGGNFYFLINGMRSHAEVHFGVKFEEVSDLVRKKVASQNPPKYRQEDLENPLVGMFYEKIGDFCERQTDMGVYCPDGSLIKTAPEIIETLKDHLEANLHLMNIEAAVVFAKSQGLVDKVNQLYFSAGCQLTDRIDLDTVKLSQKMPHARQISIEPDNANQNSSCTRH